MGRSNCQATDQPNLDCYLSGQLRCRSPGAHIRSRTWRAGEPPGVAADEAGGISRALRRARSRLRSRRLARTARREPLHAAHHPVPRELALEEAVDLRVLVRVLDLPTALGDARSRARTRSRPGSRRQVWQSRSASAPGRRARFHGLVRGAECHARGERSQEQDDQGGDANECHAPKTQDGPFRLRLREGRRGSRGAFREAVG